MLKIDSHIPKINATIPTNNSHTPKINAKIPEIEKCPDNINQIL